MNGKILFFAHRCKIENSIIFNICNLTIKQNLRSSNYASNRFQVQIATHALPALFNVSLSITKEFYSFFTSCLSAFLIRWYQIFSLNIKPFSLTHKIYKFFVEPLTNSNSRISITYPNLIQ